MPPRHRIRFSSLALVLSLLAAGAAEAGNWPRFRGPNGAGIAADKNVPVKWTAENVLWKTAIPGLGHSSPIVYGGRVFLQSSSDDGKTRWLLALDAATGSIVWKTPTPGRPARKHPLNSLASSTPATDGERVYAVFWDGRNIHLDAFNFKDGKPIWANDLGRFQSQHGVGHSPMLVDGKVIVANDQDGSSHLLAFDAKSGKIVWQTERKAYRACYSTPFVHANGGGEKELIVASTAGITGYNPADGRANWSYTWSHIEKPLRTVASPITSAGLVFAGAGDGDGSRHLIAVKLGGQNLIWDKTEKFYSPYVPCLLAQGDYLYSVNDKGYAACHLAKSGEEVWREQLNQKGRIDFTASPILVDGKVYAVNNNGTVFVFEAAPKFKKLAQNSLGEPVSSSPAVADNHLYIRGDKHLFCIGKPAVKATQSFQVPYRLTKPKHIMVRAKINGKGPYNFILDTGAPALFLAVPVAEKLGVKADDKGWGTFERFEIEGGVVLKNVKGRVETPFQIEGMNGLGMAGVELHGMIGYNILARYRMEIDFTRDKMVWTPLDYKPDAPKGLGGRGRSVGSLDLIGQFLKMLGKLLGNQASPPIRLRGFLGVELQNGDDNPVVRSVLADGPAGKAGLKIGDCITHVGGRGVIDCDDVARFVRRHAAGDRLKLTVRRGREKMDITLKLGEGL